MTSTPSPFLDYCAAHHDWLLTFVESLVALESPSDDRDAVNRCGDALAGRLAEFGATITRVPVATAGDHLRASVGDGPRQVLLLGHFDTVWPVGEAQRMPISREGGRLHGPGVFDMKAGIGIAMLAVRALLARGRPGDARLVMLWTTDEEIGSGTSRALIETEARRSDAVLVFEPALPGGALKTSRKGCGQFEVVAHGRSAHAGVDPGRGVSAIAEIARQILAVEALQDLAHGVSVNAGLVHGGTRPNVVAEEARASIDVRAPTRDAADQIDRAMRALAPQLPGARITVSGGFERPPMERTAGVARLFELARAAGAELGLTVSEGGTGGGSDGNFTAALGIPTLDGLGAIGDGAHARHEHIEIDALVPRAALVAGLLDRLTREGLGAS